MMVDKERHYKCSDCAGVFTDTQFDAVDDYRCPLCKMPFEQMPYEPPHGIAEYVEVGGEDG